MIGETTSLPDPAEIGTDKMPETANDAAAATTAKEIGGRDGPDPTRYGDWEKNGRCIDF